MCRQIDAATAVLSVAWPYPLHNQNSDPSDSVLFFFFFQVSTVLVELSSTLDSLLKKDWNHLGEIF